jgi:hypothetical protein
MDDNPARAKVQPVYPAMAWGRDPLYYDSNIPLTGGDVERASRNYGRIWLLSATADQKLYPSGLAVLEGALRKTGFTPAASWTFRGVDVTEEVRQ